MSIVGSKRKMLLPQRVWKARWIYLFLLPGIIVLTIFRYGSMCGILLAFKDYKAALGIWGSPWIGLEHFKRLFNTPNAVSAIWTTLRISFGRLLLCFPAPILLALLINEMPLKRTGRFYQVIYTFPHFLSWVILAGIIRTLFKTNGAVNELLGYLHIDKINFLGSTKTFRIMLYATDIWKGAGYSCILYLAAISSIDTGLYTDKQTLAFSLQLSGYGKVTRMIDGETGKPFEKNADGWNVIIGGNKAMAVIATLE